MPAAVTLQRILSTLFVLGGAAVTAAEGECPAECSCAPSPPRCPLGVSWAPDRCGCCKVCARQFNEDCGSAEPCDHIKGLRCHLGAGGDPERGLCRADAQGSPCEFSGRVHQHGEDFRPDCRHQCTCMDGVVGCMPLCPQHVPLLARRCSRPRLARPEGSCCEEWVCDDDNRVGEEPDASDASAPRRGGRHPPNHISALMQARPPRPALSAGAALREMVSFPVAEVLLGSGCFPQTTAWTECSTTCGMGVSSRVTNDNPDCRLVRETRLCQVRRCELRPPVADKKGKKCQRTVRPPEPVAITFAGCSTAQRYRPRACGSCADGRCCAPALSRTVRLRFRCPDGEGFYRDVMWIQRCSCGAGGGGCGAGPPAPRSGSTTTSTPSDTEADPHRPPGPLAPARGGQHSAAMPH